MIDLMKVCEILKGSITKTDGPNDRISKWLGRLRWFILQNYLEFNRNQVWNAIEIEIKWFWL